MTKHPCFSGPDKTPCRRVRLGEPFDAALDCHLCWKFAHDAIYNVAWGGDGKIIPVTGVPTATPVQGHGWKERQANPCQYLGAPTGEKHDCAYCGGAKNVPVLACAIHGRCTNERILAYREADGSWVRLMFCLSCNDYKPRPGG